MLAALDPQHFMVHAPAVAIVGGWYGKRGDQHAPGDLSRADTDDLLRSDTGVEQPYTRTGSLWRLFRFWRFGVRCNMGHLAWTDTTVACIDTVMYRSCHIGRGEEDMASQPTPKLAGGGAQRARCALRGHGFSFYHLDHFAQTSKKPGASGRGRIMNRNANAVYLSVCYCVKVI